MQFFSEVVILPTVALACTSPSQPLPQFPAEVVRTFPNGSLEGCVLNADMDAQLGGNIFPASKDSGFTSTKGEFTSCILSPLTIEGSKFHNCLLRVCLKFLPSGNHSVIDR